MKEKNLKKRIGLSIILGLIVCVALYFAISIYKKYKLYEEYRYPHEEFYGKELYSEIGYKCSDYESEIGHLILDKAIEVAEYTGTEQDAEQELGDVGPLSTYYYYVHKKTVTQKVTFQFITCKITGNEGHLWVVYTHVRYDENGERVNSSLNILSLWYIEKKENEWHVTEIHEAP